MSINGEAVFADRDPSTAPALRALRRGGPPSLTMTVQLYFLVALPSMNVIQFFPSIDTSNFKV